jgi:hypothetical protein
MYSMIGNLCLFTERCFARITKSEAKTIPLQSSFMLRIYWYDEASNPP